MNKQYLADLGPLQYSYMLCAYKSFVEDQRDPKLVFNPDHPDADEKGYVAMPNINLMSEMVNLINASRSFEANIQAINASKSMALRAIDLGK